MITDKTVEKLDSLNIGQEYLDGATTTEIQEKYHIGWNTLHQYFIVKGIQTRPAKRRKSIRAKAPKGAKFGLWTVVSDEVKAGREVHPESKDRTLYWLCQCTCGHLSWKNPGHLKDGTSTRCKKCGNKSFLAKDGLANTNAVLAYKFNQTKAGIPTRRHRGNREPLVFNLSLEYLNELYEKQEHVCALSGISIEPNLSLSLQEQNISIDRIDSSKNYENDNVQLVDKRINMMKGSLSNEEFINLCTKVAEFNKSRR